MSKHIAPVLLLLLIGLQANAHSPRFPDAYKYDPSGEGRRPTPRSLAEGRQVIEPCTDGEADGYPCHNVDLHALVRKEDMGGRGANLNDIWGWTDIITGSEIAIVGRENGTSFVDVTDSTNPIYLGFLPSHNNGVAGWRDIKVYADHAFIVADGSGNFNHGMQVFDLTQLRTAAPGSTFSATAHHGGFGNAHNIAINEDSGFAYVVGSNRCGRGLYMIDISDPALPQFAGCYSGDGYTHDVQCVNYNGPDARFLGREICAAYNEDTLTIVDVTDKNNPVLVSRTPYADAQYTHQGWFLDGDHTYIVLDDELDEMSFERPTRTYLFDVRVLDAPVQVGFYSAATAAIDHNLYTRDGFIFQSNYRAGLSILRSDDIAIGQLEEVAFFDTIPCSNTAQFSGTWSSYVYFPSGTIVTSDIGTGMFVLSADWDAINAPGNDASSVARIGSDCADPTPNPPPTSSSGGGGGGSTNLYFIALLVFLAGCKRLAMRSRKCRNRG